MAHPWTEPWTSVALGVLYLVAGMGALGYAGMFWNVAQWTKG